MPKCPACNIPLALFTPHERTKHVNDCLDAPSPTPLPCAICSFNLTPLTPLARQEHMNRCADKTLPVQKASAPPPPPPRLQPVLKPKPLDKRVERLLTLLGLQRYAKKLADEEIDLEALKLLDDADFAQMKIPDAPRRRIAQALQNVHFIEENRVEAAMEEEEEDVVKTQPLRESRLGNGRSGKSRFGDESDEEFERAWEEIEGKRTGADGRNLEKEAGEEGLERQGCFEKRDEREESGSLSSREALEGCMTGGSGFVSDGSEELLKQIETGFGKVEREGLEKRLEIWKERREKRERERHFKEMKRISERYERMKKGLFEETGDSKAKRGGGLDTETGSLSKVDSPLRFEPDFNSPPMAGTPPALDSIPEMDPPLLTQMRTDLESPQRGGIGILTSDARDTIDLTRDSSEEREAVGTPPTEKGREEPIVISTGTVRRRRANRYCGSDDEDGARNRRLFSPVRPRSFSRDDACEKNDGSEEEFMDLIDDEVNPPADKENILDDRQRGGEAMEDDAGGIPNSSGAARENATASKRPPLPKSNPDESLQGTTGGTTNGSQGVSRLKRPRKVDAEEVREAIRKDKPLYDDILMMITVPFGRILDSVRGEGVNVSKKSLLDMLQKEGVSFKWDKKTTETSQRYFNQLSLEVD